MKMMVKGSQYVHYKAAILIIAAITIARVTTRTPQQKNDITKLGTLL